MADKTLYDDLGLPPDCSQADIKAAYRKLAQLHHPDKGGEKERFVAIGKAYEILSDPAKRKDYDDGKLNSEGQREATDEELAMQALTVLIGVCLERPGNFLSQLRAELDRQISSVKAHADKARQSRVKVEKKLKHIIHKGKGENFIKAVLEKKIASLREQENMSIKAEQIAKTAKKLLEAYEDSSLDERPSGYGEMLSLDEVLRRHGFPTF